MDYRELVDKLDDPGLVDEIRARLDELDAESKALRVLLRSAAARQGARKRKDSKKSVEKP